MNLRPYLLVLIAAGCGDDSTAAADAGVDLLHAEAPMPDARLPDGAADGTCTVLSLSALAEADTILSSTSPDFVFGTLPLANVGSSIGSVGLFRFDVTALPTSAAITSARVELTFAAQSSGCASSCGSCQSVEHAGNFALFYLRSDWVESQASWNRPATGLAWGAAGASQSAVDRSALPIATITHQPGASESIAITEGALADLNGVWRRSNRVSFELVASNFGVFVIATRESAGEACVPGGYMPARLLVEYCP